MQENLLKIGDIMEILVRPAQEHDTEKILHYIREFFLDNENISYEQFLVAEIKNDFAGFGRIKQYDEVYEIASIGVLEKYRKHGVGRKIVEGLISIATAEELWITTRVPDFFAKIGFKEGDNCPDDVYLKCERVCGASRQSLNNVYYMCYRKKA